MKKIWGLVFCLFAVIVIAQTVPVYWGSTPAAPVGGIPVIFQLDTSTSTHQASAYIPTSGLVTYQTGTQPSCSSTTEGTPWYIKASGATPGYVQWCIGQGNSTFAWVTQTLP